MKTATAELPLSDATDIAVVVQHNPAIVLLDAGKRDDLFAHIRREVEAFEPDLASAKGRDAIKSLAYKITRTKTAIDAAGKQLNEEARAKINIVDAARRVARDELDRMADEVRKPLTDWEEAEKARVELCREWIADFKHDAIVTIEDTADTVRARGQHVFGRKLDPDQFGDMLPEAEAAKAHAVETLKAALIRLTKEEADRAELEKLRAEAAEREARETAEREAREAEQRAAAETKAAEERRAAAEKAEAERLARIEQEAADRAKREAESVAQAERDRIRREHDQAIAAERARAEEAERKEAARAAEEKRLADEEAKRARNRAHRSQIMGEAKLAIMAAGKVDEDAAVAIVKAIVAGSVPHVSLAF